MKLIELTKDQFAAVDDDDFESLRVYSWKAGWSKTGKTFYAYRNSTRNGKSETVLMHRQILGLVCGDKRQGDHIDHNTLDNRRCNLRVATREQQQANKGALCVNKSGFKGVEWNAYHKKYRAQIQVSNKKMFLGYFATPEDAHAAYNAAARSYHGDFAFSPSPSA